MSKYVPPLECKRCGFETHSQMGMEMHAEACRPAHKVGHHQAFEGPEHREPDLAALRRVLRRHL